MTKKKPTCIACGSHHLTPVQLMPNSSKGSPVPLFSHGAKDASFGLCDPMENSRACGLLQSLHHEDQQESLPSSTFRVTRDHLRCAATEALELISGRDCAALDIGCNDGTLLSFYPQWVERFGVDTDASVSNIGEWAWSAQANYPSQELDEAFGTKMFDIITCISTLEYCQDPAELLNAIKARLVPDGVVVLETLYAPVVISSTQVDSLAPSLCGLYTLNVLEDLARRAGLKIFKGALTGKDGGSIRLFLTHAEQDEFDFEPWSERLAKLWDEETVLALRDRAPYQAFRNRADSARETLQNTLRDFSKRADIVCLLGTDENSQCLIKWLGKEACVIRHVVDYGSIAQSEPSSKSALAPCPKGLNAKVISPEQVDALSPDVLIAPARHKREMLEQWRDFIFAGGQMLFASPEPFIVHAGNYSAEYGKVIAQGDGAGGVETLRAILHASGGPRLISHNEGLTVKAS